MRGFAKVETHANDLTNDAVADADRFHHWHGFTQMAEYEPLLVERAEGNWLIDSKGRRLLDGVSSLWCNVHGHRHPRIDAAIIDQLSRVAHVTSIGMGCVTTAILAERLAEIAPGDLQHVFFSSDGSSAVEAALKMAMQYWHLQSQSEGCSELANKVRYLSLGAAYHGDTTGAVSLGDIPLFHKLFAPILFQPLRGPLPDTYRLPAGVTAESALEHYAAKMEALICEHADDLAAVVVEPLVQGAAGMVVHPDGFLRRVRQACDAHNVLLVADEVATGFGRTGKMFACEHESVVPDLLCLGKGLTGGYLPMAATIARRHVFDAFLAPRSAGKQFFHGHTFGGNPLAAAAAIASLDIFRDEAVLENASQRAQQIAAGLVEIQKHRHVGDIRQRGTMVGIELVEQRDGCQRFAADQQVGNRVCQAAMERGVWIRPLGDVVVLMPPLSISEDETQLLVDTVCDAISEGLDDRPDAKATRIRLPG
ncbi:MAG TPA: adenosylmethionine--8-amino-7-oxononanoate transaminase [Planctomycetaceae bacterium]|nr:adenosylmethionine--8-amino-7-oxononanoate transaminase [Planctomycetaceae bacterium]